MIFTVTCLVIVPESGQPVSVRGTGITTSVSVSWWVISNSTELPSLVRTWVEVPEPVPFQVCWVSDPASPVTVKSRTSFTVPSKCPRSTVPVTVT